MVFLANPNHETLAVDLNPLTTTLHDLKLAIEEIARILVTFQHLYLSQSIRQMDADVLLSKLGVQHNSTLTLHIPFHGGMQAPNIPKPRLEFLNSKPPANYATGLGRGATGFTTRSDIGQARAAPYLADKSAEAAAGAAAAAPSQLRTPSATSRPSAIQCSLSV